jgi:hypothetical protein
LLPTYQQTPDHDSLLTRCGSSPFASQMRRTLALLIPTSRAMVRVDQWAELSGVVCSVFFITVLTSTAGIDGVRRGLGRTFNNPSMPPKQKSPSPTPIIRGLIFNSSLIACAVLTCPPGSAHTQV